MQERNRQHSILTSSTPYIPKRPKPNSKKPSNITKTRSFSYFDSKIWREMSIRSLIQDMRFSRSQRVVQDRSAAAAPELGDSLKQSFWAHMPQELLREVLMRIEASEAAWPPRKSVVACAGVCRSWRILTKEIVKSPVLSGKLTFPISVKQVWVFSLVLVSINC